MAGAESGIPVFVPSCDQAGGYEQIQCHQGESSSSLKVISVHFSPLRDWLLLVCGCRGAARGWLLRASRPAPLPAGGRGGPMEAGQAETQRQQAAQKEGALHSSRQVGAKSVTLCVISHFFLTISLFPGLPSDPHCWI